MRTRTRRRVITRDDVLLVIQSSNVPNEEEIFLIWHIVSQLRIRNDLRLQIELAWEAVMSGYQQCVSVGSESGIFG